MNTSSYSKRVREGIFETLGESIIYISMSPLHAKTIQGIKYLSNKHDSLLGESKQQRSELY